MKGCQFVFESQYDILSDTISDSIMELVKRTSRAKVNRSTVFTFDYDTPIEVIFTFLIKRIHKFNPTRTRYFKAIHWELLNFEKYGFVIDANSYIPDDDVPEIEIVVYINKAFELDSYNSLKFKLIDYIRHELEHLLQKGINKRPGHIISTSNSVRASAQDNYKYFLLADEIPAMVSGMYASSNKKGVSLDQEFFNYLEPFLQYQIITKDQFNKVIKAWIDFAIPAYPNLLLSENSY